MLIDEIKQKVPERFHAEPDFKALIDTVRLNNFDSKEAVLDYLKKEIKQIEEWVSKNQQTGGTVVKDLRDKMIKLGTLKGCQKYLQDYLQ